MRSTPTKLPLIEERSLCELSRRLGRVLTSTRRRTGRPARPVESQVEFDAPRCRARHARHDQVARFALPF
jgi:hypothetical protein